MSKLIVAGALLAGVGALPTGAVAASAPPCIPKVVKINGKQAAENCGPATAILKVAGKTYSFKDGFCQQSKSAGSALSLDLGTVIVGVHGNAGKPDFSMLIAKSGIASVFQADFGGKQILGDSLITARGSIPSNGSFAGKSPLTGARFSGSWNCHGVVYQAP